MENRCPQFDFDNWDKVTPTTLLKSRRARSWAEILFQYLIGFIHICSRLLVSLPRYYRFNKVRVLIDARFKTNISCEYEDVFLAHESSCFIFCRLPVLYGANIHGSISHSRFLFLSFFFTRQWLLPNIRHNKQAGIYVCFCFVLFC